MAKPHLDEVLRSYNLPLRGEILLVCGKCQRKLKHGYDPANLGSLKKLLKKQGKQDDFRIRLLKVPCLKMCPKGGVTVCTPSQVARHECSIIRSTDDVTALYKQCRADSLANESGELNEFAAAL